jgi:hypothetical protein
MRKLIYGVGIYHKGKYKATENSKITKWYAMWYHMLERCYSEAYQLKKPTYIGCSADARFHRFQDFMSWAEQQIGFDCVDIELDKDLLFKGNKLYSPETCTFIPREINVLMTKRDSMRGKYPIGVHLYKKDGSFRSSITIRGIKTHIGYYDTPEKAFDAYREEKESHIKKIADEYKYKIDIRVYAAMIDYVVYVED